VSVFPWFLAAARLMALLTLNRQCRSFVETSRDSGPQISDRVGVDLGFMARD
jgi:hypothetical protein